MMQGGPLVLTEGAGPSTSPFVNSVLRVEPLAQDTSGIVIRRPGATWGDPAAIKYSTGQLIEAISEEAGAGGFTPRGAYAAGTSYAAYDTVTYGGNTYWSRVAANLGHQPDVSPSQWSIVPTNSTPVADQGAYNGATTYAQFDRVSYNNVYYYSTQAANTGNQPDVSPAWWSILSPGNVLWRVDKWGGTGQAGGAHFAPGIHGQLTPDYVKPTQALWVNPFIDTVGMVMFNAPTLGEPTTPVSSYILLEDIRSSPAYIHNEWKADGSYENNKAVRIKGRTTSDVALTLSAIGGSLANMLEAKSSAGTTYMTIDAGGNLSAINGGAIQAKGSSAVVGAVYGGDTPPYGYRAIFQPGTAATGILYSKAIAAQTGEFLHWEDSAGTAMFRVDGTGAIKFGTDTTLYRTGANALTFTNGALTLTSLLGQYWMDVGNTKAFIDTGVATTGFAITERIAANVPLRVKGAASQSGNLQEWSNSAGSVLSRVTSGGSLVTGSIAGGSAGYPTLGFSSGAITAAAADAADIPLVSKGFASQTASLQEWQDSTSAVLAKVDASGVVTGSAFRHGGGGYSGFGGAFVSGSTLTVYPNGSGNVGFIVKGAASQAADLQRWQDSTGAALSYVDATGMLRGTSFSINPTGQASFGQLGLFGSTRLGVLTIQAATTGVVVKGVASQTADLQQWQDSTSAAMSRITAAGAWVVSNANSPNVLVNPSADAVGITVRGMASQTVNLQEWQDSTPTTLLRVTSAGVLSGSGFVVTSGGQSTFGSASTQSGWRLGVLTNGASTGGVLVKATAAQTADLQNWQDSTGAVMTKVTSGGTFSRGDGTAYVLNGSINPNNLLTAQAAAHTPLALKGFASQTANLQEWQDSTGTVLSSVSASGTFAGPGLGGSSPFTLTSTAVGQIPLTAKGFSGQTASLTEWQSSTSAVLARIEADGRINSVATASRFGAGAQGANGAFLEVGDQSDATSAYVLAKGSGTSTNVGLVFRTLGTSGFLFQPAAGGTPLLQISATGQTTANAITASTKVLIVKGAASQTANLQEWQLSTGAAPSSVYVDGSFYLNPNAGGSPVLYAKPAGGGPGIQIDPGSGQSGNLLMVNQSAGPIAFRLNYNTHLFINKNGAPADGDFGNAGEIALAGDQTVGAPKLIVKGSDSNGLLFTTSIPLGGPDNLFRRGAIMQWHTTPSLATVQASGIAAPTLTTPGQAATNTDSADGASIQLMTTAVANNIASAITSSSSYSWTQPRFNPENIWKVKTGASIANVRIRAGLTSAILTSGADTGVQGAYFRYATDTDGTAFWRCCTCDGTAINTIVTTSPIAAATAYTLRINVTTANVKFYVNDVLVATSTNNLPTAAGYLGPQLQLLTIDATQKSINFGRMVLTH